MRIVKGRAREHMNRLPRPPTFLADPPTTWPAGCCYFRAVPNKLFCPCGSKKSSQITSWKPKRCPQMTDGGARPALRKVPEPTAREPATRRGRVGPPTGRKLCSVAKRPPRPICGTPGTGCGISGKPSQRCGTARDCPNRDPGSNSCNRGGGHPVNKPDY